VQGGFADVMQSQSFQVVRKTELEPQVLEALAVEAAVRQVLADGYRTGDIMSDGCTKVGTIQMGDLVAERIH
jgi:isocitrate/isopropylmalate dehydrogenase